MEDAMALIVAPLIPKGIRLPRKLDAISNPAADLQMIRQLTSINKIEPTICKAILFQHSMCYRFPVLV